MFGFIKKMLIGLINVCTTGSFGGSLASNSKGPIKCISLNYQPCQVITTIVDINFN